MWELQSKGFLRGAYISFFLFSFSSCFNFFQSLDKPKTDAQLLESARNCSDRKDYSCAIQYYQQLSSAYSDIKNYELALLEWDQAGFGLSELFSIISTDLSSGGGGTIITQVANLLSRSAGETLRLLFFEIYQRNFVIQDSQMRSFIRFLGSLILGAEILAEASSQRGNLLKSDLVTDVTGCINATLLDPSSLAACNPPSGTILIAGTGQITLDASTTKAQLSGSPTLCMLQGILIEINNALKLFTLFDSSIGTSTLDTTTKLLSLTTPSSGSLMEELFRQGLIVDDVGGIGEY